MFLKLLLVLIAILFMVTLMVKRFVYFHPTYEFLKPKDTYTDVHRGNLHAWYKKGSSDKVILFCHGNSGNISHRQDKLIEFSKMGHSVLIFDYSGFGLSRGVPNEDLCYNNASIFFEYLLSIGYNTKNIIPYGESLGAPVASYVARKYNTPLLIIESGLTNIKDIIKYHFKFFKFLTFLFPEFNTYKFLKGYIGKILFIHSTKDQIIPYEVAQNMWSQLNNNYVIMTINGTHNEPNIDWSGVNKFISGF